MDELKLLPKYFKQNIKRLEIYDADFYLGIIGIIIENILNLLMLFFIYQLVPTLAGFTFNEMLLLYGTASLSFSIWRCFFINTLNIGYMIRHGNLDSFLLRPLSVLYQVMMDGFDDDAWGDLVFSIILVIYANWAQSLDIGWVILLIIMSFVTSFIFAGLSILGSMASFVSSGLADFSGLVYNFFQFSKYPIGIFGNTTKFLFTFIIPMGWVAAIPIHELIEKRFLGFVWTIGIALVVSMLFFWITTRLWAVMLNKYVSAGS